MRQFLTTKLVQKSAGVILTDAPGGPRGPIKKMTNKIRTFSIMTTVLSLIVLCYLSRSVLYIHLENLNKFPL